MELFKNLDEVTKIDNKHLLMGTITGAILDIELLHTALANITLHDGVPDNIHGQFNVARNMALYTYYFYALASEVHLKTYTVIEHALRIKANSNKKIMLKQLLAKAIEENWITDKGFRHIENPSLSNKYCKTLTEIMPNLRNNSAHGTTLLLQECIGNIEICADFINQLFSETQVIKNVEK